MNYLSQTFKQIRRALIAVCMLLVATSGLKAQEIFQDAKNDIPDDSLFIAQLVIDSIPKKFSDKEQAEIIEELFVTRGIRFEEYNDAIGKLFITYPINVTNQFNVFDRQVKLIFTVLLDVNSGEAIVNVYGAEKLKSRGKNYWRVMNKHCRPRTVAYHSELVKDIRAKFKGKQVTIRLQPLEANNTGTGQ